MKRILLLLVLCLGTLTLQGQGFQWLQNGGGTNSLTGSSYYDKEQVIDIATDSQRNVYVVSTVSMLNAQVNGLPITTFEVNPNDTDFVIASYSCDGTYRWHKVFGGGGSDFPAGIEVDSQDNVYVVGYFEECQEPLSDPNFAIPQIGGTSGIDYTSTNSPTACQRAFMAKFNSNGVFQWIHYTHAPLAGTPFTIHPYMVRNFYMVNDVIHWILTLPPGTYENGAFSNTNSNLPFLHYLLQYDTSGNFISAIPFDLQMSDYISGDIRWYRNPYNGYYYAKQSLNNNSMTMTAGGTTLNAAVCKVICFNTLGQYQWHMDTPSTNDFLLNSIDFDANNNVYISGVTNTFSTSTFLGWSSNNLGMGNTNFIMKCNATITSYDWVSCYVPSATQYAQSSMKYTPTAIYFAGQMVASPFVWGNQSIAGPGSNNGFDPLLARLDPATGACTSLHRIVGNNGSNDTFTAMELDNAGDLILGGAMGYALTDSNNVTHYAVGGNTDFFVTKFASQACQSLGTTLFEETSIRLYPNPSKGMVTLDYKLETAAQLQIIDLSGRVVLERELAAAETSVQFATTAMASGVYAVQVLDKNGGVWRSKLIVE